MNRKLQTLLKELIGNNPIILGIIFLLLTALGVCYIIGAVKNWDWLYEPDKHYQNNCTMG